MNKKGATFGTIVAVFGSILIILGIAWLIAQNWHQMPALLKIIILVGATCVSYILGTVLRVKDYSKIGGALLLLGALLYTWSIFLIAQIFATSTSMQGTAWLLLLAWVGVVLTSYVFHSSLSLVLGLGEFLVWLVVQHLAFSSNEHFFSGGFVPGILALYFLFAGILFYGISLWHRARKQEFSNLYQLWTAFYFLLFTYLLSFQSILPHMWPKDIAYPTPALIFLIIFGLLSLTVLLVGISTARRRNALLGKELGGVLGIILLLSFLVGVTRFVSFTLAKQGVSPYFPLFDGGQTMPFVVWAAWIFINISFIAIILAFIGYGTWLRQPKVINIGISFFALDIITRYLGFMMQLWGYTSLSVVFISGGIILIVGGWLIEKWRRTLVRRAQ